MNLSCNILFTRVKLQWKMLFQQKICSKLGNAMGVGKCEKKECRRSCFFVFFCFFCGWEKHIRAAKSGGSGWVAAEGRQVSGKIRICSISALQNFGESEVSHSTHVCTAIWSNSCACVLVLISVCTWCANVILLQVQQQRDLLLLVRGYVAALAGICHFKAEILQMRCE